MVFLLSSFPLISSSAFREMWALVPRPTSLGFVGIRGRFRNASLPCLVVNPLLLTRLLLAPAVNFFLFLLTPSTGRQDAAVASFGGALSL
ncbi:hypothetical protein C8R46DRAFT_1113121 [Mycena filopes]|nr:hypothetical protein C8R46DRAFT_1113121 [Mycena filopes]